MQNFKTVAEQVCLNVTQLETIEDRISCVIQRKSLSNLEKVCPEPNLTKVVSAHAVSVAEETGSNLI